MQSVTSRKQQTKLQINFQCIFSQIMDMQVLSTLILSVHHSTSQINWHKPKAKTLILVGFFLLPSLAVSLKNSTTLGTWLHALRPHFQVPLIGPIYSCSEQDSTNFIRGWRRDSQWAYHIQSEGFTILELPCCSFRSCHIRLTDGRCSNFILHDLIYLWDQLCTYFVLTLLFCILNTVYNSCT